MADNPQSTDPNVSLASVATAFVGTVWGKVVAILAAISLIMGIALEVQSFVRGNYDVETSKNNAAKTLAEACAEKATLKPLHSSQWAEWEQSERKRRPECFSD